MVSTWQKASFSLAIPQSNGRFRDYTLANTPAGFNQLLALLPTHSHCEMEASGPYYLPLALVLTQHGQPLSVPPLVVRRFSQMRLRRTKTDKADARLLSEFGANQRPQHWQASTQLMSQLTHLQTLLEQYIKQRTALRNQQESFAHSGVPNPILEQSLQRSLDHLQEQIQTLEQQLDQLATSE